MSRILAPPGIAGAAVMTSIAARSLSDRLSDPDLWWHLKAGALTAAGWLPRTDPFSFTAAGERWVQHEWGAEVLLRWIESAFGLRGLIVWRAAMLLAIYALVARLILREAGTSVGSWALVGLTAYAGASIWTERPNLFSFLLFAILLTLVARRDRAIWWFVPMAALWVNLHGMFLVGLGLLAVVAAAETLKPAMRWEGADVAWARRLWAVLGAGLVATMLNPYGPKVFAHAFTLVRRVSDVVTEWASPDFHEPTPLIFLALVLVAVAGLALSPRRADPTDVALLLAFLALGLFAARNLLIASLVVGWVAARSAPAAISRALAGRRPGAAGPRRAPPPLGALALGAVALATVGTVLGMRVYDRFPRSGHPAVAAEPIYPVVTLQEIGPGPVRLFTEDEWAGFAIWLRWPAVRVAMDTRFDFYPRETVRAFRRAAAGLPGWDQTLAQWCVTHVLVEQGEGLAARLEGDPAWRQARRERLLDPDTEGERTAVLFVPRAPLPGCER